jgi:hypothetical protein
MARRKQDESVIQYGSEEHVSAIQNAYGIRPEIAEKVIREFESGEKDWDVNYYSKCKRMMSVINAPEPKAISQRQGWKRDRSY